MKKDEETGTAVESVLDALFDQGHATSLEIAETTGLPVSQVSSALSRIYKRLPDVIARDAGRRPYRWRVLTETESAEAYRMYLAKTGELPEDVSTDKVPEPAAPLDAPHPASKLVGMGTQDHGLIFGGMPQVKELPTGPFEVRVTGRIEIAVGWVGKL